MQTLHVQHTIMMRWAIYAASVLFVLIGSIKIGVLGLVIGFDVTYLGTAILGIYVATEIVLGYQHITIDRSVASCMRLSNVIKDAEVEHGEEGTFLITGHTIYHLTDPELARSVRSVSMTGDRPDESKILDSLHETHGIVRLAGEMIVALGIFGTVCGVILTLIPFLGITKFDVALLQPELLKMFTGMAVAFFPTALSILLKVMLDINEHLMAIALRQHAAAIMTVADAMILSKGKARA